MLLSLFTRLLFKWKDERGTPTTHQRLINGAFTLITGFLCFSLCRNLLASSLAFGASKGSTLSLPGQGTLSVAHAYAQYRQTDLLMDLIIRTGIDPITMPLMVACVCLIFAFLNYCFLKPFDGETLAILREIETLHGQVQVQKREPFGQINWCQLRKSPVDFFRAKLEYLGCLATGKECTIRRHATDGSICFFPYLTVRNQARMLFLTYVHEGLLIHGYLFIFVLFLYILYLQYSLGLICPTLGYLIHLLDTCLTFSLVAFQLGLFVLLLNRAYILGKALTWQYGHLDDWLAGRLKATQRRGSNLSHLQAFRTAHSRVSYTSLTQYNRYIPASLYTLAELLNMLINSIILLSLLYDTLTPLAQLTNLALLTVQVALLLQTFNLFIQFNRTVNQSERKLFTLLRQPSVQFQGKGRRVYPLEHWRCTVYYERLRKRELQLTAGDHGPFSQRAVFNLVAAYVAFFLFFLKNYEKN